MTIELESEYLKSKGSVCHSLEKTADGCKTKAVGTMRSSRTNGRETKAVAKAVRRMRSSRTNGRETKAVVKAVRRMCR